VLLLNFKTSWWVRKSAPSGTTRYLWDGDDLVAELDAAGGLVREYAYYPGIDQPTPCGAPATAPSSSTRRSSRGT